MSKSLETTVPAHETSRAQANPQTSIHPHRPHLPHRFSEFPFLDDLVLIDRTSAWSELNNQSPYRQADSTAR